MGGLWVDYNLQSNIPGLFAIGEANFSDHGANRLGASALMQGLADGYFIIPYTIANYLAGVAPGDITSKYPEFKKSREKVEERIQRLSKIKGRKTASEFHRQLGDVLWDSCGMSRHKSGLERALLEIPEIRQEFWDNVIVPGSPSSLNQELERALRIADFLEFGQLMVRDALTREESCGCHFRSEYQTDDNEALRNDKEFSFVSAWEYKGVDTPPELHKEPLIYEFIQPAVRSYK